MLADKDAMATIAVKDLAAAKKFYQQKLGFSPTGIEGGGVVTLRSGNSTIVVYKSQFAGTNKATSATWGVGKEMNSIVQNLKEVGVAFEHYGTPGLRREGDIHVAGGFQGSLVQRSRRKHPAYQQSVKCSEASRGFPCPL